MTTTDLKQRLVILGNHLDEERNCRNSQLTLDSFTDSTLDVGAARSHRSEWRASLTTVAAALLAAVVVGGLALGLRSPAGTVDTAATTTPPPPAAVPAGAPEPGSVAPFVETPPDWFGQPVAAERVAGHHRGAWVSAAIAVDDGKGGYESPIRIGVTDGSLRDLGEAASIVVDGRSIRLLSYGTDWQAIATTDQPTVVVSGAVDLELLVEVLDATRLHQDGGGNLNVELTAVPDGYSTIVGPQEHAVDTPERRTFAGTATDIVINEVSEWVRADLAAAATGADFRQVPMGGLTGYTGTTDVNPVGPVTFLIWSPEPGVVFEIDTTDASLQTDQLIDLATRVEALPIDQWDLNLG